MGIRVAVFGLALAVLGGSSAQAQETPEAAYAQLHAATLGGKIDAALGLVAGPLRADLTAKPQAEREGLFRNLAQAMPRTYRVIDKSIDGAAAQLTATGISEYQGGRTEAFLSATLRKEGEDWKVASWTWSSQKPAALVQKPAAPAAAVAEPVQESKILRRMPGTDPNLPATAPAAVPAKAAAAVAAVPATTPRGPSRAGRDARDCLKLPTDSAIRACAEKFR